MIKKETILETLAAGRVGEVVQQLRALTQTPDFKEWSEVVVAVSTRFNDLKNKGLRGLLSNEDTAIETARITHSLLEIIRYLPLDDDKKGETGLSFYHKHTCGRVEQTTQFYLTFQARKAEKCHFFVLAGDELQSHEGFFKRIGYDLEGVLEDYINPGLQSSCRVLKMNITFDASPHLDIYKKNVVKSLFAAASLNTNVHGLLNEKDLSYLVRNSPVIQGLGADDFVCVLLSIGQYDWDKRLTPLMVRWFVRTFCRGKMPDQVPTFLFFFAIMYEEENEATRLEVKQVIESSKDITPLPHLEMVDFKDVARWFEKYRDLFSDTRNRKNKLQALFPEREFYMEDVENRLQQVIDEYNKSLLT